MLRNPQSCFPCFYTLRLMSLLAVFCCLAGPAPSVLAAPGGAESEVLHLPWREAGLTEHEAAAWVLDRLAYGARPGEVERVVAVGVETWVTRQLSGGLKEPDLEGRLSGFHSLGLSARQAADTYPNPGMVLRLAERQGFKSRDEMGAIFESMDETDDAGSSGRGDRRQRREVMQWAEQQGFRPMRELFYETLMHKLLRATYAENQLTEVLVDFWFNHFNVSLTDNDCRVFIPSYERDAIRPHVLGEFGAMLEGTAKHPAMLLYLDNARSIAEDGQPTTLSTKTDANRQRRGRFSGRRGGSDFMQRQQRRQRRGGADRPTTGPSSRRPEGLNENYARELMELHTLGVDGGYTQDDVVEVARAFSGWSVHPPGVERPEIQERIAQAQRHPELGFVFGDGFIFRADAHDAGRKRVLGHTLAAGRGMEDGLEVLDLVVSHPSTARHLALKLSRKFVADDPPSALVDRIAAAFAESGGDLQHAMRVLVESSEFWSPQARRQKIKSPFELTVSALRALDADLEDPRALVDWIGRMGQPLYAYQAPTGYPDGAEAWVNTGSLLNRMNFGLQLATGRVAGVVLDLPALNDGREPESLNDALVTYLPLLLPQRDSEETVQRLEPVIHDPSLLRKIEDAAPGEDVAPLDDGWDLDASAAGRRRQGRWNRRPEPQIKVDDSPLAQVVGVILGSPEFQRR